MSRRFIVRSQARLELAEASDWYDEHSPGLGDKFLDAFDDAVAAIRRNPFQYQTIRGKRRRVGLGKFPYGLIYIVSDDEIIVVSCFHGSRNPRRWKGRKS
jgi:plasmid stabilization system protein ParE